jgi:hypothetical protein
VNPGDGVQTVLRMIIDIDHVQITVPANAVAEARDFY